MPDLREQPEQALGATYRIDRELGGGGMSGVFLTTETWLDRQVVIKVLPQNLARLLNPERFEREIQIAAKLQYPHIGALLSAGLAAGFGTTSCRGSRASGAGGAETGARPAQVFRSGSRTSNNTPNTPAKSIPSLKSNFCTMR